MPNSSILEEIPKEIPRSFHEKFKNKYEDCLQQNQINEEEYSEGLENDIEKHQNHRTLVNLCVAPFSQPPYPEDYRFIRGDPLMEMNVKNFDFLLYDFDGHAIFGEAKSNINRGREMEIVVEVLEQKKTVNENRDYIEKEYIGRELKNIECVLATYSHSAENIAKKIISEREEIITWAVHKAEKQITISTPLPDPNDLQQDLDIERIHRLITHNDTKLNSTIDKINTHGGVFDFFPNSIDLDRLRILIKIKENINGKCMINVDEVCDVINNNDLFYLEREKCQEIAESIISEGVKIDFLKEWKEDDKWDYKIKSRYTSSDGLEETLIKKWIDRKIEERKEKERKKCFEKVKKQIKKEAEAQSKLTEFFR